MSIEFIITICTMLIGFLSIILMIVQMNTRFDSLRTEFKEDISSLRTELKADNRELRAEFKSDMNTLEVKLNTLRTDFKSDMNTLEVKLNTLILGLFRSYQNPEQPPKQDQH